MYTKSVAWLCALLWTVGLAVTPLPPRPQEKTIDCTGPIAFSSTGTRSILAEGLIAYKQNLVNLSVTWSNEVGVFTCSCSGLYQFSFSGYTKENTRMVLKKRMNNDKPWIPILSTKPGGGSATIILEVKYGNEVAVFLDGIKENLNISRLGDIDITSFSGYRIAKT